MKRIEFLSDITRTYTTFVVGAGAMAYYLTAIFIKSLTYILIIEISYVSVWILLLRYAERKREQE